MTVASDAPAITVALIGNPNTGKSTLFGALSGVHQRIGNYPGVTVEKKVGHLTAQGRKWTLVDLPGTYSLAPRSPDEMVAVDVLLGRRDDTPAPEAVLCIVDATNLERNLYLVSQVLELGRPTVVALTMMDVATSKGVTVDIAALSRQLGVPVVPIQAHRRKGLDDLTGALAAAASTPAADRESPFPEAFRAEVARLEQLIGGKHPTPRYLVERLLLDTGGYLESKMVPAGPAGLAAELSAARDRLAAGGLPVPAVEAVARYGWVGGVLDGVVRRPDVPKTTASDRLDRVFVHRVWGTAFFIALMVLLFQAVFTWSVPLMDLIDDGMGWLASRVEAIVPEGALQSLLVDGVLAGFGGVIIFLPQIAILFLFLGILEDCGYLARAAYLMDRLMTRVGLSGKSFIPMLSSFACAIPGVMATRVIEDRRDRLTTMLVAPLMSCSARLPVYTLLISAFIPARKLWGFVSVQALTMVGFYAVGVVAAAAVALVLKRTLFRGPTPPFVMELPAYRWPSWRVVTERVVDRSWSFVRRAGTMIVAVSIVMWALLYYPRLPAAETSTIEAERSRLADALAGARWEKDDAAAASLEEEAEALDLHASGEQRRRSYLGRAGHLIEPAVRPLGWDWRIGAASLASFPAREVVVATLGVIFDAGEEVEDEAGSNRLQSALKSAKWEGTDRPLFNLPVALSLAVFFALCAQCVSTLAVMKRETNGWTWPVFCFVYMTVLAYAGAFVTYRLAMLAAGV